MSTLPDADLLQAYLDCRLSSAEAAILEERLLQEPALADALLIQAREEAILTEWASAARVADNTAAVDSVLEVASPTSISGAIRSSYRKSRYHRRAFAYVLSAAAVIMLALVGITFWQQWQDRETLFLADLEEVQGDVSIITASGMILPARAGHKLFADQELRTSGEGSFAVVKYEDKTRLELSPDTLIRLLGEDQPVARNRRIRAKKLLLNEGVLSAEVVEQPTGYPMVLTTPQAILEVQESTFSSSSTNDATRIELDEGRIQFTRRSDGRSIEVAKGYYAVAAAPVEHLISHALPGRAKKPRALLKETPGPVLSLRYSLDGKTLALACRDGTIRLCDSQTGAERVLQAGHRKASSVMFSRDGKRIAAIVDDRAVKLWDTATLREQMSMAKRRLRFNCLSWAAGSRILATACADKSVRLWDPLTGLETAILKGNNSEVVDLAFSPDGTTLAAGEAAGAIVLWNMTTRAKQPGFVGHKGAVRSLAFSADGEILASSSDDGTVRLWDWKTGQVRQTLHGHAGRVVAVAFSPDGARLASAGSDNTVRLWETRAGKPRAILKARKHGAYCLAFSPDGKTLATGGWDKSARLWDATWQENSQPSD